MRKRSGMWCADILAQRIHLLHRILYISAYLLLAAANTALYVSLCTGNPGWLQPGVHALSLSTMKRDSQVGPPKLRVGIVDLYIQYKAGP